MDRTPDALSLALVIDLFGTLLLAGFVMYGQRALNEYWDRVEGRRLGYRVSVWQWILLGIGGLLLAYDFITSLGALAASFMLASY